jgi:cysteinyl-tRNA synthetase
MKLYNTLSRSVEELRTIENKKVRLYTCGLTVYSQPHIGNWVSYIYWDVLVRTLESRGYVVDRVQNITDVGHLVSDDDTGEDKMEKGARKEGVTAWQVAEKYIEVANEEAKLLGLLPPNHLIRATDLITEQIEFVKILEAKGYTYTIDDGVYFDSSKLGDYGKLARLDISGLQAGARVSIGEKKNPTDFALWKFSPKYHDGEKKRDMEWESPWGTGFPGWHLECSVIARQLLGDQIDIHTGGIDHIPVHHTNEIAQTEALTDKTFSTFWMHANHIKVDGTKISKSLGNGFTLNDIIQRGYSLQAFKLMVLSKHYRTEGNFTWEILEAAQNRLNNWRKIADMRWQENYEMPDNFRADIFSEDLERALENDLDTPAALIVIEKAFNAIETGGACSACIDSILQEIEHVMGIVIVDNAHGDITDEQKALIAKREQARLLKDWSMSDNIRDELLAKDIELKDTPNGTIWNRRA